MGCTGTQLRPAHFPLFIFPHYPKIFIPHPLTLSFYPSIPHHITSHSNTHFYLRTLFTRNTPINPLFKPQSPPHTLFTYDPCLVVNVPYLSHNHTFHPLKTHLVVKFHYSTNSHSYHSQPYFLTLFTI